MKIICEIFEVLISILVSFLFFFFWKKGFVFNKTVLYIHLTTPVGSLRSTAADIGSISKHGSAELLVP